MKRFSLALLISSMCLFAFGCDSDSGTDYDDSSKAACEYLIEKGGEGIIEIDFDASEASADQIKKAKELCVKELDNLPYCNTELIRVNACEYAVEKGELSTKEMEDALKACNDEKCEKEALKLYPCNNEDRYASECWNELIDNDEVAANKLDEYIENYRKQYEEL